MTWLVKKVCDHTMVMHIQFQTDLRANKNYSCAQGDDIPVGKVLKGETWYPVEIDPRQTGNWSVTEPLYYCYADIPPGRCDETRVKQLCSLTFGIPWSRVCAQPRYQREGKEWTDVAVSRDIMCGGVALSYLVMHEGQKLQSVEADYMNDI